MQWDDSPHAGFSTDKPWIDVNPNYRSINVAADRAAEKSVFRYYRRLIKLRHQSAVVALGEFEMLAPEDTRLFAFRRTLGGESLGIICNVSGDMLPVPLSFRDPDMELVLGNYSDSGDREVLRPWEARVHDLRGVSAG
jgi:oligo-1,6-glucosidase